MHPWARERFGAACVARLASVDERGDPHLVPVTFVLIGDVVWSAVDGKPKSTRDLARLRNIWGHPRVSLLVDHYDEDWEALWWVRVDGTATVVPLGAAGPGGADATTTSGAALSALIGKYPPGRGRLTGRAAHPGRRRDVAVLVGAVNHPAAKAIRKPVPPRGAPGPGLVGRRQGSQAATRVHGHEKVPTGGQVRYPVVAV